MKAADYTAVYTKTIKHNGDKQDNCDIRARILTPPLALMLSAI